MAIYLNILGHLSKDTFLDLFLPYYRISIRLAYYKTPEESEIHSLNEHRGSEYWSSIGMHYS